MADIDYDRLSEALADALERSSEKQEAVLQAKKIDETAKALSKLTKSLDDTSTAGKVFQRWMKGQNAEYNSLQQSIKKLEDQIEATKNPTKQQALITERTALETKQRAQNFNAAIENASLGFARMTKEIGNSVASATGGFVKGIQGGQSSFELSAGLMSGAVDVANQGVQAAAGGLQGIGQIAAGSTNPKLRALGVAAGLAGTGLGMFGNQASRLAKFGIEVLSKELEKTIGAYQRTSASGALFADGLQGMRTAAGAAGLTVDQFSNVISKNSVTLADSGLGVGEATRRMGQVGKVLKDQGIDKQLLRLGYGFEEQAELTAEVMGDMRRANSAALLDPNQVAKSTQEYATNLRTIAAITGEDAKKKMEESRRLTAQTAIRIKLQELEKTTPGILEKYQQAITTMTPEAQKAIGQLMSGQAVTGTEAVQMAVDPSFQRLVEGTVAQLNSGRFSVEENQRLQAETNAEFLKNLKDNKDLGTAFIFGKLQDLDKSFTSRIENANKVTEAAVEDARTRTESQKQTSDKLTESYINAAVEAQKLALKLQTLFDPFIASYAEVTDKMLEEINKTFEQINAEIKKGKEVSKGESAWETTKRVGGAALSAATTTAMIAAPAAQVAAMTGIGAVPAAVTAGVATVGAGIIGGLKEWFNGKEGKARGGIARGPSGGFLEKLHGSEAVVPLPDGKTIPVHIEAPVAATMPTEPSPAFATQRLELTGIENIENMARSFVERPTGRLDAGFEQFLSEIRKTMTETTVAVQATAPAVTAPAELPAAEVLKETIEQTSAVMSDLMREHTGLMRESLARVSELVSVTSDTKNINQQLLNNSY